MPLLQLFATLVLLISPAATHAGGNELRLRLTSGPENLDWTTAGSQITSFVFINIMEGLVSLDDRLTPQPALAKSIEVSADGTTYTFHLRPNVRWTDGIPLAAEQFVASWKRLLDPLDIRAFGFMLSNVVGATDYNHGKVKDFSTVGIKALDALTLKVSLIKPQSYFLQLLTNPVTFPYRKDLADKYGPAWQEPGKTAVLGPFMPVAYEKGRQLSLKRNPTYHGPATSLELVTIAVINEDAIAAELFKKGKLDVVIPINHTDSASFSGTRVLHNVAQFRTRFLFFNSNTYPFNLSKVRNAVAHSLDRTRLAYAAKQGFPIADTLVPPGFFPEGADVKVAFDLKAAKSALEESGLVAEKVPPLELVTLSTDQNTLAANEIAAQLRKNLGLAITVKLLGRKSFMMQVSARASPMYYLARGADYADISSYLAGFTSDSGLNVLQWKNAKYDELVTKAATVPDGPARKALYREALQLLIAKEYAIVPLHFEHFNYLVADRVKNFTVSPLSMIDLRRVAIVNP